MCRSTRSAPQLQWSAHFLLTIKHILIRLTSLHLNGPPCPKRPKRLLHTQPLPPKRTDMHALASSFYSVTASRSSSIMYQEARSSPPRTPYPSPSFPVDVELPESYW